LILAMANLFYRDVKFLFEIMITAWMFATPVVYPLDRFDGTLAILIRLNPMTPIVEAYRAVLLYNTAPEPSGLLATTAVSLLILLLGWRVFHKAEYAFAENI
jgi:ABC-type polysaccharide/polyol phosphate export permease